MTNINNNNIESIKEQGNNLFKLKKHAQARNKFLQAILLLEASPDILTINQSNTQNRKLYVNLLTNCALCSLNLKTEEQYKLAIIDCDKALAIQTDNLKALYRRGLARKQLGQLIQTANKDELKKENLLDLYKKAKQDLERLTLIDRKNQIAEQKLSQTIKNFYRIKIMIKQEPQQQKIIEKIKVQQSSTPQSSNNIKKKIASGQLNKILQSNYKLSEVTKQAHEKVESNLVSSQQLPKTKTQFEKAMKTLEKSDLNTFVKFAVKLNEQYLGRLDLSFDMLYKIFFRVLDFATLKQNSENQLKSNIGTLTQTLLKCRSQALFWKSLTKSQKQRIRNARKQLGVDNQELWGKYFI